MDSTDVFRPGARLGRYELIRAIASGGMATVWAARLMGTRGFQKIVALKVMHPSLREEPDAERMFLAEARLASRIRHPNVVEVLDLGEEAGALYIVMEWLHGVPLSTVLSAAQRRALVPPAVAVRIVRQVAAGLHAAHRLTDDDGQPLGLVHRDISPHNILVGFNGVTKVVDFGIAKVTSEANSHTELGQLKGKIAYMAPEQLRGDVIDHRADLFATGIVLYLMTTGMHPYRRPGGVRDAVASILSDEAPPAPTSFVVGYPPRLEAVVMKALAKDRDARYQSAEELEADLGRVFPPSAREGETVREYVRELLPDSYMQGVDLARLATNPLEPVVASSSFSELAAQRPHSSSTLRAVAVTAEPPPPTEGTGPTPTMAPLGATDTASTRISRLRRSRFAAAAAGAVATAMVGFLLVGAASRAGTAPAEGKGGEPGAAGVQRGVPLPEPVRPSAALPPSVTEAASVAPPSPAGDDVQPDRRRNGERTRPRRLASVAPRAAMPVEPPAPPGTLRPEAPAPGAQLRGPPAPPRRSLDTENPY